MPAAAKNNVKLTTVREKKSQANNSEPMTDELYNKLSEGQGLIAAIAEAKGIEVMVVTSYERPFVDRETVGAVWDALFE